MGFFIPLIVGAGARILGGAAVRQAATQGARAATTQGARTAAKKTAKKAATKTTRKRTTAKKTAAKKTASKKTTASTRTRGTSASGQTRTPGFRTVNKPPKWAQGRFKKDEYVAFTRQSPKEKMQQAQLNKMLAQKSKGRSKRVRSLRNQAAITGGSAVAYEGARYKINTRPQPPKTSTPIRVKRKNAPIGYEVNYDPNRKKK